MKDRIIAILFSTRTMSVLLLVFAISMAVGTFIENSYDTPTSKLWVYNTWWFSLLMLWLMLNFIGNIKRYQLWQWKKWATLTMHLSWILIIIGAGITRYISYEGMMLIRETINRHLEQLKESDKAMYLAISESIKQTYEDEL